MEKERPRAPRPAPPDEVSRDDVRVTGNRCPYCRDDVQPEESVVCQGCLTRHHPACWDEAGKCSSCGGASLLTRAEQAEQQPPAARARPTARPTAGRVPRAVGALLALAATRAFLAALFLVTLAPETLTWSSTSGNTVSTTHMPADAAAFLAFFGGVFSALVSVLFFQAARRARGTEPRETDGRLPAAGAGE